MLPPQVRNSGWGLQSSWDYKRTAGLATEEQETSAAPPSRSAEDVQARCGQQSMTEYSETLLGTFSGLSSVKKAARLLFAPKQNPPTRGLQRMTGLMEMQGEYRSDRRQEKASPSRLTDVYVTDRITDQTVLLTFPR